jgi:hypothetical protein
MGCTHNAHTRAASCCCDFLQMPHVAAMCLLDQRLMSLQLLLLACAGDQVSPWASLHCFNQSLEPITQALAPFALAVHSTQFTLLLLLLPGLVMWRAAVASHSQRRDTFINTTLHLHHKHYMLQSAQVSIQAACCCCCCCYFLRVLVTKCRRGLRFTASTNHLRPSLRPLPV